VSTRTLPYPAQLERELEYKLRPLGVYGVRVTPCDDRGRKSAAWSAAYYEIKVRFVHTPKPGELDPVEAALKAIPGVYRTTQEASPVKGDPVTGVGALPARILDLEWPVQARHRRGTVQDPWTTPGALALMADPEKELEGEQ
jgi:hypothetical protein